MFLEPQFAEFGKQVVLFAHVTTRIEGRPYDDLLVRKGRTGFPSFVMMDANGEALAIGGARTVAAFTESVEAAQSMQALAAAGEVGDGEARKAVFLQRLEWLAIPFADAKAQAERLDLTDAERAGIVAPMLALELNDARLDPDRDSGLAKLVKIHAEDRIGEDARVAGTFWRYLAMGAEMQKDADVYALYVEYLRGQVEANPRMQASLDRAQKTLEAMKN